MIKKLQRRFILITMASLLAVMILLLGTINAVNLYQMNQKINGMLHMLSENQGRFPDFERIPPKGGMKPVFDMNEETKYQTRYFTATVSQDGSVKQIDTSHIAAVSPEDALDYSLRAVKSGKSRGFFGIYKYLAVEQQQETLLVFLDCRDQLQMARTFFINSCIVAVATLVLVLLLVSFLSKRAIKPFVLNAEKQKQFITDAGHEIKTPLAIISANADVLEMTVGNNEWITSIRNQVVRLDKLVKSLLLLSKMEEGTQRLSFQEFDLSKAVSDTAGAFRTVAETQNKTFIMEVQPGIRYYGDESSIQQVVSSLADNAIKYSNDGGIIKVSMIHDKKGIKLEVYNTLDQLDTRNLDRFFDRFYRGDASRSGDAGSYGIGLSIAKSVVEAHHGKISVKSEDGRSILFTVVL